MPWVRRTVEVIECPDGTTIPATLEALLGKLNGVVVPARRFYDDVRYESHIWRWGFVGATSRVDFFPEDRKLSLWRLKGEWVSRIWRGTIPDDVPLNVACIHAYLTDNVDAYRELSGNVPGV